MADQNLLSGVNLLQLFSGIFFFKCHNICCCKIKIIALEQTNLKDYFVSGAIFFKSYDQIYLFNFTRSALFTNIVTINPSIILNLTQFYFFCITFRQYCVTLCFQLTLKNQIKLVKLKSSTLSAKINCHEILIIRNLNCCKGQVTVLMYVLHIHF